MSIRATSITPCGATVTPGPSNPSTGRKQNRLRADLLAADADGAVARERSLALDQLDPILLEQARRDTGKRLDHLSRHALTAAESISGSLTLIRRRLHPELSRANRGQVPGAELITTQSYGASGI